MGKTHRDRLVENIDALSTAYDQMIELLEKDVNVSKVTSDKWKGIAEGKAKTQDTADKLLKDLKIKEYELYCIDNPEEVTTEEPKPENPEKNEKRKSNLSKHLQ